MITRKELVDKIPYGYAKTIAKRAGVSKDFMSRWMAGKANSEKVEMATLEVLAELSQKKKNLLSQIL